jgi:hypothetical protein
MHDVILSSYSPDKPHLFVDRSDRAEDGTYALYECRRVKR